jgi:glutamate-1-semialdehyde 2,1-aminomutase
MASLAVAAGTGRTMADLIRREEERFLARQPRSADLRCRAVRSLAGGATSNWMIARPGTVWLSHGVGSRVFDVDGTEYVDLHAGYGAMLVGHAHPAVVEAVTRRVNGGTHFAQPTEDAIVVAEALAERFGLPLWRFSNSGTEATMDAIHLMRAVTGRDLIVKIEGSYHGHHDAVMISYYNSLHELGPRHRPSSVIAGGGIPQAMADLCVVVPFNDLAVLERALDEHAGRVAGMIIEPMMMNAGIVPPEPGYLEGVRELTRRHGVLLAFDEVKTGLTVHAGGATSLFGVRPDIVCLAKALGGGVPCGAIGGTVEVMEAITDGRYEQVGTFNGNPLTMAAARATLTEVLTPATYERFEVIGRRMQDAALSALRAIGLPVYVHRFAAKGCLVFHPRPVRDYREFLAVHGEVSHAHWLVQHNGGVFLPPWGKSEQWTLSAQHTMEDADRFIANVERFAAELATLDSWTLSHEAPPLDAWAATDEVPIVGGSGDDAVAGAPPTAVAVEHPG